MNKDAHLIFESYRKVVEAYTDQDVADTEKLLADTNVGLENSKGDGQFLSHGPVKSIDEAKRWLEAYKTQLQGDAESFNATADESPSEPVDASVEMPTGSAERGDLEDIQNLIIACDSLIAEAGDDFKAFSAKISQLGSNPDQFVSGENQKEWYTARVAERLSSVISGGDSLKGATERLSASSKEETSTGSPDETAPSV